MKDKISVYLKKWIQDTNRTWITLMKIMVPAIIVIKILEELGLIKWLSKLLNPVMGLVGLPGEAGLVWATTLLTNIYAGLVVFFTQTDFGSLNVMQLSILGSMMLIAHALIIEVAIAKKAGLPVIATLALRIGGAFIFGVLVNLVCSNLGLLQEKVHLGYMPSVETGKGLAAWGQEQLYSLFIIYLVIAGLIALLRLMELVGINKLIQKILSPVLRSIGISKTAGSLTLIGMTLGLSYGGGLLINESKSNTLSRKDILLSICLISLYHSIIEDTILILLMGANISVILVFRLFYALAVMFVINKVVFEKRVSLKMKTT